MTKKIIMSNEDDATKNPSQSVLGQTSLLAQYYNLLAQCIALCLAQVAGMRQMDQAVYSSRLVPASAGGLARRRLTDPEARFYFAAMMAEAALLPLCIARDAAEKEALNAEIAQIVRVDVALP